MAAALAFLACSAPLARPCDSTACLMQTRGSNGVPGRGRWVVDLSFRYTEQGVGMEGSRRIDDVRRPWVDFERQHIWPRFHREIEGVDRFYQVDVVYGVGWGSALQLSMPVYSQRSYSIVHGSDPFTYRTHGPGDVVIGLRRSLGGRLVGGVSVKLPSGRSDVQDRYGTYILDPMIQPGTGSLDLASSLQYGYRVAGFDGALSGSYQRNRANGRDFRFGADLIVAASVRRRVAGPLSASLQVKGVHTAASRFLDQTVPSTGARVLYINPGLQVTLPRRGLAYAYVPYPAYRDVRDQQLTPRVSVLVGLSKSF